MSSRISLMSKIPLNTVPRTLTRSLKCSRFRRLGAQNRSFLIRLRAPARPLHAFSHSKALWEFISVAVCVFYYCRTYYKAVRVGGGGEWRTCAMRDDEPRPVWMSLPITH